MTIPWSAVNCTREARTAARADRQEIRLADQPADGVEEQVAVEVGAFELPVVGELDAAEDREAASLPSLPPPICLRSALTTTAIDTGPLRVGVGVERRLAALEEAVEIGLAPARRARLHQLGRLQSRLARGSACTERVIGKIVRSLKSRVISCCAVGLDQRRQAERRALEEAHHLIDDDVVAELDAPLGEQRLELVRRRAAAAGRARARRRRDTRRAAVSSLSRYGLLRAGDDHDGAVVRHRRHRSRAAPSSLRSSRSASACFELAKPCAILARRRCPARRGPR